MRNYGSEHASTAQVVEPKYGVLGAHIGWVTTTANAYLLGNWNYQVHPTPPKSNHSGCLFPQFRYLATNTRSHLKNYRLIKLSSNGRLSTEIVLHRKIIFHQFKSSEIVFHRKIIYQNCLSSEDNLPIVFYYRNMVMSDSSCTRQQPPLFEVKRSRRQIHRALQKGYDIISKFIQLHVQL